MKQCSKSESENYCPQSAGRKIEKMVHKAQNVVFFKSKGLYVAGVKSCALKDFLFARKTLRTVLGLGVFLFLGASAGIAQESGRGKGPVVVESPTPSEPTTEEAVAQTKMKEERPPIQLPIPVGQEVKGIKIPHFTPEGKLQMEFVAGDARRESETEVFLTNLRIEFFDDTGKSDMLVELPVAVLDLKTQVLSSEQPFTLQRSDFLLRGEKVQFDTRTREGRMTGKVKMTIYDASNFEKNEE